MNLVVLVLLIPALSSFLVRGLHLHEMLKDKRMAQISGVFLVAGSTTVAIADSWIPMVLGEVLFSLGFAFAVPARSLVTGMVEQRHLGTLYTVISVLTYIGVITGEPLFAAAFRWGMQLGSSWIGLPYLFAAACFVLILVAVSTSSTKTKESHDEDDMAVRNGRPEDEELSEDEVILVRTR